MITMITAYCHS